MVGRASKPGQEWKQGVEPSDRWRYGDAGDRIEMKRGEIWTVGQRYMFAVADLECGDVPMFLKAVERLGVKPTAMYSDPPWDKGNASTFRTKAFGAAAARVDFLGSLLPRILDAAELVGGPTVLEMGNKHADDLAAMIRKRHGMDPEMINITYYRTEPCKLLYYDPARASKFTIASLANMDDAHTVIPFAKKLIKTQDAMPVLFDCCTGLGTTPMSAADLGIGFVGTELNPRRMAATVDVVSKKLGLAPIMLGMSFLEVSDEA